MTKITQFGDCLALSHFNEWYDLLASLNHSQTSSVRTGSISNTLWPMRPGGQKNSVTLNYDKKFRFTGSFILPLEGTTCKVNYAIPLELQITKLYCVQSKLFRLFSFNAVPSSGTLKIRLAHCKWVLICYLKSKLIEGFKSCLPFVNKVSTYFVWYSIRVEQLRQFSV